MGSSIQHNSFLSLNIYIASQRIECCIDLGI